MVVRVAFQGELGSYSHIAAIRHFKELEPVQKRTIADVFDSVERNEADYGIVPFENSLEGSVNETYDMLLESDLKVVGEVKIRIVHCLIANEGVSIEDIRHVYSHPQALAQCRSIIRSMGWDPIPFYDTSGSVRFIKESGIRNAAAIASELAASIHGLPILRRGIEDSKTNFTRFLLIGTKPVGRAGRDKTSIIFTTMHAPGALYSALEEFAKRKINLTMLVSRPTKKTPWEYNFYLDFEGHVEDPVISDCLNGLRSKISFLKVLGSYPIASEVE